MLAILWKLCNTVEWRWCINGKKTKLQDNGSMQGSMVTKECCGLKGGKAVHVLDWPNRFSWTVNPVIMFSQGHVFNTTNIDFRIFLPW